MDNLFILDGVVHQISEPEQVAEKLRICNLIIKREEGMYTNKIRFQVMNDRIDYLKGLKKGEEVKVDFKISGKETKEDDFFVNLNVIRVTRL